jgi:hypothetical protein
MLVMLGVGRKPTNSMIWAVPEAQVSHTLEIKLWDLTGFTQHAEGVLPIVHLTCSAAAPSWDDQVGSMFQLRQQGSNGLAC